MLRSEHPLKQLYVLASRVQRGRTQHGTLLAAFPLRTSCVRCQARRFHISTEKMSPKYLPHWRKMFLGVNTSSRMMSSSGDSGNQPIEGSDTKESATTSEEDKSKTVKLKDMMVDAIVKIQSKPKKRPKIDMDQSYYDNIFCSPMKAMSEYLVDSSDLYDLPNTKRRSPYPEKESITVYLQKDVERIAIKKWGSLEALNAEKKRRELIEKKRHTYLFQEKQAKKEYWKTHFGLKEEKPYMFSSATPHMTPQSIFKHGSGKVVLIAISVNAMMCLVKLWAWYCTGSHSMFSEFIHSVADTANQVILAVGIHQSLKQPDMEHPYGWMSIRNIASLISGVGIFCLGAGLSIYHGTQGLLHPQDIDQHYWAIGTLMGAFISEGCCFIAAVNLLNKSSKAQNMSMIDYVFRGHDPSTNVVLLEDAAAMLGVVIALGSIGITHFMGHPMADAVGSLLIGSLLAGVASFIIYTNSVTLVGRSIPPEKKQILMNELESDRMIRTLHDVKATDMGGSFVRFKAEVDFDGKEITRYYLEKYDLEQMLLEANSFETIEDMESFMLKHGENIVDTLGGQVDRIERNLKKKHPEVRHVDLEQL